MGIYSNLFNDSFDNDSFDNEFVVSEEYATDGGAGINIMRESLVNDFIDFDDSMRHEFREEALRYKKESLERQGLYSEAAEVEVLTEGAKELANKAVAMLKSAGSKLVSLIKAFAAKVLTLLNKDKAFKKYKGKFAEGASKYHGKWSYATPKNANQNFSEIANLESLANAASQQLNDILVRPDDYKEFDIKDNMGKLLGIIVNKESCSSKDFKNELFKKLFNEKTKTEGPIPQEVVNAVDKVVNGQVSIKDLKNLQKKVANTFKSLIADANKLGKGARRAEGEKSLHVRTDSYGNRDMRNSMSGAISTYKNVLKSSQTAANIYANAYISLVKSHIAQSRALFSKVVFATIGNTKKVKPEETSATPAVVKHEYTLFGGYESYEESADDVLVDAVEDVVFEETIEELEGYSSIN